MKKKYFVFSDVHGEFDALMESLKEAGYDSTNPNHQTISLGDNFDRGPQSREVFDFLRLNHTILILGNHEEMLIKALEEDTISRDTLFNCAYNGLLETLLSFDNQVPKLSKRYTTEEIDHLRIKLRDSVWRLQDKYFTLKNLLEYKMNLYYETKNYIFVHAGIQDLGTEWRNSDKYFMLWDIKNSHEPLYGVNKKVVIGHHHAKEVRMNAIREGMPCYKVEETSWGIRNYGNQDENAPVAILPNKLAIDGCTNLTKKVNVIVLEDEPIEQKGPVKEEPSSTSSYTTTWTRESSQVRVNPYDPTRWTL